MTPRKPRTMAKVPQAGHYKRPLMKTPGMSTMNAPRPGRVGRMIPQMKKLGIPGLPPVPTPAQILKKGATK